MKAIVIHAPHDLRYEQVADQHLGRDDVRVKIEVGGICGSDLHYYRHGGFGAMKIRHPMILGHEIAGIVTETGQDVTAPRIGQRVAVTRAWLAACAPFAGRACATFVRTCGSTAADADALCRRRLS
jgi:threonine dehydrogenase-like Zn-dependent dehydrogenase